MTVTEYIYENLDETIRRNTEDEDTLLGLPYPYTVPCIDEMFLEMYYWDTYFTNVGLIADGNLELAKNNIDDMLYLVNKYGFMPNGSRTYYLDRSQPPFLYLGVKDIYEKTGDKKWLLYAYKTLCKEYDFWQTKRKFSNGLNFYGNHSIGEVQISQAYSRFLERTKSEKTDDLSLISEIAHTYKSFVESGWDCNSRFEYDGQFYIPVELNSLLYGFEISMAEYCEILSLSDKQLWEDRANARKNLMKEYLYDENRKAYVDFNIKKNRFSPVLSAASLYPYFVDLCDSGDDFKRLFSQLILPYGVSSSVKENTKGYQWDYPNIWPPVQYIAYVAAKKYGFDDLAETVKKTYINLIEESFEKTENLWEKYDGISGLVANQDYNAPKMLGWTAGVYLFFKNL